MADHLWFIPVSSGNTLGEAAAAFPIAPTRDLTNVQWNFNVYPISQVPPAEASCLSYNSYSAFTMGSDVGPTPSELVECYARWRWRSCADHVNILNGGQLAVGTVFARELPLDNLEPHVTWNTWNIVDVWAKYRVDVPARLDNIFLSINDRGGNVVSGPNLLPLLTPAGVWRVAYLSNPAWEYWDTPATNLRVVMSFQGTTNLANVGTVNVDMEWFAIRLREEIMP